MVRGPEGTDRGCGAVADMELVAASAWHFLIGGALLAGMAAIRGPTLAINRTGQFLTVPLFLSLAGTAAFLAWFREATRPAWIS
ncbi:hypothetical protein [Pseudarthrobacter raffinosi]|uniref:hypothetical protein n=2 Tax=Pseudarthrobacter raffinosi TaxID=2953651 RepID=UPI00208E5933|nr:hypothetical protein [Pseudarthrobacter sp. MDT3-9]MCO4253446.1 hypothetical protein [Pseudarthrobacter sp. MDT3-9]MCO4265175.1 hypothetical protein [Pseudarthrobacter sp. MDT3-26]